MWENVSERNLDGFTNNNKETCTIDKTEQSFLSWLWSIYDQWMDGWIVTTEQQQHHQHDYQCESTASGTGFYNSLRNGSVVEERECREGRA